MNLYHTLKHMFPHFEVGKDYFLRDDGDGLYIEAWANVEVSQPTSEEIRIHFERNKEEIEKPIPSQIDAIEQTQADLIFQLMINGVI